MDGKEFVEKFSADNPELGLGGDVEHLGGGELSDVWRVSRQEGSAVVKRVIGGTASRSGLQLDRSRLVFEARALETLGRAGELSAVAREVRTPKILAVDEEASALALEDLGELDDLADSWDQESVHISAAVGARTGDFVGRLHRLSAAKPELAGRFRHESIQQVRHRVQYVPVAELLKRAGRDDLAARELGARAIELGEKLQGPGMCLVHGNLWPHSVLVDGLSIRIVDWEFCTWGWPLQDVAHFVAHLWMHANHGGSRKRAQNAGSVLRGFLQGYGSGLGGKKSEFASDTLLKEGAVHFASELLVRALGRLQSGYLYTELEPTSTEVQEVVETATAAAEDWKAVVPELSVLFD